MLGNNRGLTLIELIVASTMGTLLILGCASMLLEFTKAHWYSHYSAEESARVQRASFTMNRYLGNAINVDWTTGAINNIGGNRGQIRIFDSGFYAAGGAPPVTTVGVFLREAGYPSSTNPGSDIRATALYFINPTETQGGRLFISSTPAGFGNVTLASNQYDVMFENLVEFHMNPSGFASGNGDPVRVVKLEMTFRRFRDSRQADWRFCPVAQMARPNCNTRSKYVDEKVSLDVALVNNAIPTDFGTNETLYGNVYFYGSGGRTQ